jgi:hypothetical protein
MRATSSERQHRFWRCAIGGFLLITCLRVWVGPIPVLQRAQAQIPDSLAQRRLQLEETRRTNKLLSDIKQIIETRTFNVHIKGTDNQADRRAGKRGSGQ